MPYTDDFSRLVTSEAAIRCLDVLRKNGIAHAQDDGTIDVTKLLDTADPQRIIAPDQGANGFNSEIAERLYDNFLQIYDHAYKDATQHHGVVGEISFNIRRLTEDDKSSIHRAFTKFAHTCYEANGNIRRVQGGTHVSEKDIHEVKAAVKRLYEDVVGSDTRRYGAGMALGTLLVLVSKGPKWQTVGLAPQDGLDFTRAEPTSDFGQRIEQAFSPHNHVADQTTFWPLPAPLTETIGGITFPIHKVDDWKMHLVTETGHLVNLTQELRDQLETHLKSKPLSEFTVPISEDTPHLSEFQDMEAANGARQTTLDRLTKMKTAGTLDGQEVNASRVHLVSLDIDLLTGLRMDKAKNELGQLMKFLQENGTERLSQLIPDEVIANVAPAESQKNLAVIKASIEKRMKALEEKADSAELKDIVKRAGAHLKDTLAQAYVCSDDAFFENQVRKPTAAALGTPKRMYMSMGGTCTGKTGLQRVAEDECNHSLVIASLDDAREHSDRYWIYPALNVHNDDYKAIDQFGNAVRDLVTRRAHDSGHNIFIDGSGVPYLGKNALQVQRFKKDGYEISVLAAQAPLEDALTRIGSRLNKTLRAVPLDIMVDKHIRFPIATRNAARDPDIDRFLIEDVSGDRKDDYTLSYVVQVSPEKLKEIVHLKGKELKEAIDKDPALRIEGIRLPKDKDKLYDLKVIKARTSGDFMIEIITDIEQYINMVHKGLLNAEAKGTEGLHHNKLAFDMNGDFHGHNGHLRLQPAKGRADADISPYVPMTTRTHAQRVPKPANGHAETVENRGGGGDSSLHVG